MMKHSNYRIAFDFDRDWRVTKWAILPFGKNGDQQRQELGLGCDHSLREEPDRVTCTGPEMALPERVLYLLRDFIWPQDAIDALVSYVMDRREIAA